MRRLRQISLILVLVIFTSICSRSRSEEEPAEHPIVCQGSIMNLRCANRSFAITITSAIYGRNFPGTIICPNKDQTGPSDEVQCNNDVYNIVQERCDGRMNCSIPVNKDTLNEPCEFVYKYLDVGYKCEDVLKRGTRQLSVHNRNKTQPTKPQLPRIITSSIISPSSTTRTPSLVSKAKLTTLMKNLQNSTSSTSLATSQPVSQSTVSSQSSSPVLHSVSVSQVIDQQFIATTSSVIISNLPSKQPTSSSSAPKIPENKTKGNLRTIKLFHFILSFHVVREEYLQKHPANSFVWFLCGVLGGLHIIIAVLYCLHRQRTRRRTPEGKRNKMSYLKQKFISPEPLDEKIQLRSKEEEAMEMDSQFGETA